MRIENVDIDIFLAPQPIDSSASCISRGSAHDRELVSCLTLFKVGVFAFEAVLKNVAQELQCNILECKSGSMPKLEHVLVVIDLLQRCRLLMSEGGIRPVDDIGKILGRDRAGRNKEGDDAERKLRKREVLP